jgi:hypothetical protein
MPNAIWSKPAELMVVDESCWSVPPATTTVTTAATQAHSSQPTMNPQVLRRPPRTRMAMNATTPSGLIAAISAKPTAESTAQHGSECCRPVGGHDQQSAAPGRRLAGHSRAT